MISLSSTMLSVLLPFLLVLPSIQPAYSLAVNTSSLVSAPVIPSLSATADPAPANSAGACDDIHTCRTLYSIVQTCLATIFACVWVAVHRNIPSPKTRTTRSSNPVISAAQWLRCKILDQKQSAIVFTVTLLAPEWVLAWAVRQALRARKLARELEDARMQAERHWEESRPEYVKKQGAEMAEDEDNQSTGVSLRGSSSDELPLIEKRSASSSMSISHATHPEDQTECTSGNAVKLYVYSSKELIGIRAKRFAKLGQCTRGFLAADFAYSHQL